ncbi:MAG: hypothetical protein GX410_00745 [Elusimicrobia bacterium]|nr:hypothetical protein [Elusimicrobiota bacterium]
MKRIAAVMSVSLLSVVCGCNEPVVNSVWADKPVALDGLPKDWSPNEKDECGGFAFAAKNDSDNLYLYLAPKSAKAKQYLASAGAQNFTIWLDLDLRSEKGLGFRILSEGARKGAPGGRPESGSGERPGFGQDGPEEAEGDGAPVKDPNSVPEVRDTPVKLLGFGEAPRSGGAIVKLGNVYIRGVLEAKIPLSMLGDELPSRLMVGISADLPASSGKPDGKRQMSSSGNEMSSGRPSGGRGPGGPGGMGGPGGGMGGASMPGSSMGGGAAGSSSTQVGEEPLEIWATVILAEPPQASGV